MGFLLDARKAIDAHVGQVGEYLGSSVLPFWEMEEFGGGIHEGGVAFTFQKPGMLQDVKQKRDVGLDAPDAELPKGSSHLGHGIGEGEGPACYLYQKRVVVRADTGSYKTIAPIQAYTVTRCCSVGHDAPCVREEIVGGILCGYPTLDGASALLHRLLSQNTYVLQGLTPGNA